MPALLIPPVAFLVLFALAGCAQGGPSPADPASKPPSLVRSIPLPQITGGTNHLAADTRHKRFFVTAPGDKTVVVVDLEAGSVAQVVKAPGAAAAAFAQDTNELCVAGGGAVTVYDGDSYKEIGRVEIGHTVDELHYVEKEKRLYVGVMDPGSAGIGIIDVPARKLVALVGLPSKPQGFAVEEHGNRILANTPQSGQVAVIDRQAQKVVASWRLADAKGNYPIALDEANHRLFVGCRKPAKLLVLDTDTGRTVAAVDCVGDTDDLFYDAATRRVYVSGGEGAISVIEQVDADTYRPAGTLKTAPGARTSLFVPELRRLYLAVPHRGDQAAEIRVFEAASQR